MKTVIFQIFIKICILLFYNQIYFQVFDLVQQYKKESFFCNLAINKLIFSV